MHDIDERGRQREVARSRQRTTPRVAPYQLDVIGIHAADVVDSAGGWLFDRVMAGWAVRVAVTDPGDLAALQILGVQTVSLATVFGAPQAPAALAVAGAVCGADDRVSDALAASVRSARTEVTVWGDLWVPSVGRPGDEVRHELSSAARVFKSQAAFAAGLDPAVGSFEVFRSYGQSIPTEFQDLLPVG